MCLAPKMPPYMAQQSAWNRVARWTRNDVATAIVYNFRSLPVNDFPNFKVLSFRQIYLRINPYVLDILFGKNDNPTSEG